MVKGGNERPEVVFKNHVGIGRISVVSVCPEEEDKEGNPISYVKNVKRKFKGVNDENTVEPIERDCVEVSVVFKLQVEGVDEQKKHVIRIYDVENASYKDYEATRKIKYEWINCTGNTAWAFDESELKDKFLYFMDKDGNKLEKKSYRKALVGETELFTFMNAWVGDKIRRRFITWDFDIPTNKLFNEDFKSISSYIGSEFDGKFCGMFYVETSDDGEKFYQKLFGKAFLKADFIKYINNGLTFPDKYSRNSWEYFTKQVESPDNLEYALKGFYTYSAIKEYDPSEDLAAKVTTDTDDAY